MQSHLAAQLDIELAESQSLLRATYYFWEAAVCTSTTVLALGSSSEKM